MILITGASGNAGQALQKLLAKRKVAFRTAHSQPQNYPADTEQNTAQLDFRDKATFSTALTGCAGVFLMRPPAISDSRKTLNVFIDVARQVGVTHIVFMSVIGASKHSWIPHHATEQHLRSGPADWTILQPTFFAQNLQGPYAKDIRDADRIYLPAGSGKAAFIDVRDIAQVAALAFSKPDSHLGQTWQLSGPAALDFDKVASILSSELNRFIRYDRASVLGYALHLYRQHLPAMQILVQTLLHVGLRFGQGATVTADIQQLLGRGATPLHTYVQDHAALWRKPNHKLRAGK